MAGSEFFYICLMVQLFIFLFICIDQYGLITAELREKIGKLFYSKYRLRTAIIRKNICFRKNGFFRNHNYRTLYTMQRLFQIFTGLIRSGGFIKSFSTYNQQVCKTSLFFQFSQSTIIKNTMT